MKIQPQTQPQTESQDQTSDPSQDQSHNAANGASRTPFAFVERLLERSQRRFRLSRPGSVLILCVALLVLLALIGTAMISTARIDRYASVQHTYNTQIDLLVEGVKAMAEGVITSGDMYDASNGTSLYRPPDADINGGTTSYYEKFDGLSAGPTSGVATSANDMWLAPRVPQLLDPTAPLSAGNPIIWKELTMPLAGQTVGATTTYHYDSPLQVGSDSLITSVRDSVIPTSITVGGTVYPAMNTGAANPFMAVDTDGDGIADAMYFKLPMGPIAGVTYYAACRIIDNNSAINANTAWSRDYDFTNISGGFSRGTNPSAGTINYGIFRSNVGLMEMFPDFIAGTSATMAGTSAQMNTGSQSINAYRFNGMNASADYSPKVYFRDPSTGSVTFRSDFIYTSQGDGLEFGLASRLENPGINYFTNDGTGTASFRAFSWGETSSLASRFAILNSSASPGDLENCGSLGLLWRTTSTGTASIESTPYVASDTTTWFNKNFDYNNYAFPPAPPVYKRMPMRALLVSRNPVSNLAPIPHGPYDYNGDAVGSMNFNGTNTAPGGNDPLIAPYLTLNTWMPALAATAGAPLGMTPYKLGTGGLAVNAKTNINTAPFEELWRAFWCVMCEPKYGAQLNRVGACPPLYSPESCMFRSPSRDPRSSTAITAGQVAQIKPTPSNMMQIRSAEAAVNAIDLRDGDDDITSREVPVYDMTAAAPVLKYRVRVFGNERQPFITKVYYNGYTPVFSGVDSTGGPIAAGSGIVVGRSQNLKGYVAIELYNPYPTPMQLNRWAVGVINRQPTTATPNSYQRTGLDPGLHIAKLTPRTPSLQSATFDEHYLNQVNRTTGVTTNSQVVIPAKGYAILENYPPAAISSASPSLNDAQFRPQRVSVNDSLASGPNPTVAFVYVPNLTDVIQSASGILDGGELVLLRPRRADGTLTKCDSTIDPVHGANNVYHEAFSDGTPNLADLVPIDSFDFTGLVQVPTTGALFPSWYYARPNDTGANAWKFVYPGTYNVGDTTPITDATGVSPATPRQEGTYGPGGPGGSPDFMFAHLNADNGQPVLLGQTIGAGSYTPPNFPGIQLQNVDWGKNSTYIRWPAATSSITPVGFPAQYDASGTTKYQYPFGGFARNGDMMMVPFIGAYQILPPGFFDGTSSYLTAPATNVNPTPFYEFTPITMDCSFADDCFRTVIATRSSYSARAADTAGAGDDADEQIGRFCPIQETGVTQTQDLTGPTVVQSSTNPLYSTTGTARWKYHFATRLFDYLTVQGGSDDYLPLADPNARDPNLSYTTAAQAPPYSTSVQVPPLTAVALPPLNLYPGAPVIATQNSLNPAQAADHRIAAQSGIENRLSVDGLININTAPWYVLAQLPLLPQSSAGAMQANGIPTNIETLAKEIVKYRENVHPFTTIFDLNALFTSPTLSPMPQATVASGGTDWDISSGGGTAIQPTGDFKQKYLLLTRISNLITTRSDTYTVYIVVDGFQNAGTANPVLRVHRRVAMIVDRSAITPEPGTDFANRINVASQ